MTERLMQVVVGAAGSILTLIMVAVWGWVAEGQLIDLLNGVTKNEFASTQVGLENTQADLIRIEGVIERLENNNIVMSDVVTSPGDCQPARRKVVGNFPDLKFCALSQSQIFRHGQNKGDVYCQVALEQNNWVLIARGATHECGSTGGATYGKCQAICWQER